MKTLIKFFVTYGVFFLFLFLEIISVLLVVNNNQFQRTVFFSAMNEVAGSLYEQKQSVVGYFSLRRVNEELAVENATLRNKLMLTENELNVLLADSLKKHTLTLNPDQEYTAYSAKVINNSTNKAQNYITLNKGYDDGIRDGMTVVCPTGVVGVVSSVSQHFSIVMSLLNTNTYISAKIKGIVQKDSVGSVKDIGVLRWNEVDPRYAEMSISRHVPVHTGDSVITSGYSDFFPEGIMIGKVSEINKGNDDNLYDLKVELSVNFKTISYVNVFEYKHKTEQETLQLQTQKQAGK
jgi:rod shape-determining protein MreC